MSAILVDCDSGRVLFEKDADRSMLIASTTKIMTALVALETCDLDETVAVRPELLAVEGSRMYLAPGEEVTVRELLYGLLLMSGIDAAMVLADHCAGSVEAFVGRMNAKARALGLQQTHFENPHGLDGKTHRSTARELAKIAAEAMRCPEFAQIVATQTFQTDGRFMRNHNRLLRMYPDAVGMKTGYTREAGRCLVSAARRDGRTLVVVTLKAPDDWNDHMALLNYGFSRYTAVRLLYRDAETTSLPVVGGTASRVGLRLLEDVTLTLTEEEQARLEIRYETPRFLWAPVSKNTVAGTAVVMLDGKTLARRPLFVMRDVPEAAPPKKSFFGRYFGSMRPQSDARIV